jgi:hypothetical protein
MLAQESAVALSLRRVVPFLLLASAGCLGSASDYAAWEEEQAELGELESALLNQAPTVTLTSPADGSTLALGFPLTLTASAADPDGVVARVEFFANGQLLGEDVSAPFTLGWSPLMLGAHSLTAVATDDTGARTTSGDVLVNVAMPGSPPSVSITSPSHGGVFVPGSSVTVHASASDPDGLVSQVEFFAGQASIGVDTSAPFSTSFVPTTSVVELTARATDDTGRVATSQVVRISQVPNGSPSVVITAPSNGATITQRTITVAANAADADGFVRRVEFFDGSVRIGQDTTSPFTVSYRPALGQRRLTAIAFDNLGARTTSSVVRLNVVAAP